MIIGILEKHKTLEISNVIIIIITTLSMEKEQTIHVDNATSMYNLTRFLKDGIVVKIEYTDRLDAEENLRKIYGLDF